MQILTGLKRRPVRMAFSPDGRFLAVGEQRSEFHVWDATGGHPDPLWSVVDSGFARNFAFAPDSESVAVVYHQGVVQRHALTGKKIDEPDLSGLAAAQFTPGGQFVVSAVTDRATSTLNLRCVRPARGGWVELWHAERVFNPGYHYRGYRALLFAPDGARVARVSALGRNRRNVARSGIEVLDTATGAVLADWAGDLPTYAYQGVLSLSGGVVFVYQRALYAVDTAVPDSAPVKRLNVSQKHFTAAAFAPDGSRLATTSNDTAATIWDAALWEVRKRYEWNIGRLRTVCFAPDGLRCAAAGDTGQIVVWDLDD